MPVRLNTAVVSALGAVVVAAGCGSRTDMLEGTSADAGGAGGSSSGGSSSSGSSSGSGSGGSPGGLPDAAECLPSETLCGGACVNEQTDANNCGGCGLRCSVPCTSGRCFENIAKGSANAVAVDATNVYWTTSDKPIGNLMSMPKVGGTPVTLSAGYGGNDIAVDGTSVYWTCGASGAVQKVPIGGGNTVALSARQDTPWSIRVDHDRAYWNVVPPTGVGGSLSSVPLTGGTPTTLVSSPGANVGDLAIDATNVYWTSYVPAGPPASCVVARMPLGGGTVTTLASATSCGALAVTATDLYLAGADFVRLPLAGGTPTTIVSPASLESNIAMDATQLLVFANQGMPSEIVSLPLVGAPFPVTLALPVPDLGVVSIAVDDKSIYLASLRLGVFRVTPK